MSQLERAARRTEARDRPRYGRLYDVAKRGIDIVGSSIGLIVFSPVMLGVAIAIAIDDGLPIFFRSHRVGKDWRDITVWKFRTMHDGTHHHLVELLSEEEGQRLMFDPSRKTKDDPRRTRVGTFLRRASLDELPQLWNVLRGEMSLVGPRPCSVDEISGITTADEILSVRPGITGLWQVSGRSDLEFDERMRLDVEYVRNRGLLYDSWILLKTIGAVITARGAY